MIKVVMRGKRWQVEGGGNDFPVPSIDMESVAAVLCDIANQLRNLNAALEPLASMMSRRTKKE